MADELNGPGPSKRQAGDQPRDCAVVTGGDPLDWLVVVERGDRRSTLVYGFQDEAPNSKSRRTPKRELVGST
jgi:hypothetical protein